MNLVEAKQILKNEGYRLIRENSAELTYTPEEIFDDMWYRRFRYRGEDKGFPKAPYKDFQAAFIHGYKKDMSVEEMLYLFGDKYSGDDLNELKYAYIDGEEFNKCKTNDEIDELESDYSDDAWFDED